MFATSRPDRDESISGSDWRTVVTERLVLQEYEASRDGSELRTPNRAHGFQARFMGPRVEVTPRGTPVGTQLDPPSAWSWSTTGWGRPDRVEILGGAAATANGTRVTYAYGSLDEWYDNSPKGLEQGFTITSAPTGSGPLVIDGEISTPLCPKLTDDELSVEFLDAAGSTVLHYGGLFAFDAEGRPLRSRLSIANPGSRASSTNSNRLGRPTDGSSKGATTVSLRIEVDDLNAAYPITIDPLITTPSWTAWGSQASGKLGFEVNTAGDVNGDGYSDILVASQFYDRGQADEGLVFLYHGGPDGPSSSPDWHCESNQVDAELGSGAATAGDVNGDGYDDVIIGARYYTNGEDLEGAAFVYLGGPSGLGSNGTPSNADWRTESNVDTGSLGMCVATAGDINGDGFADAIISGPFYTNFNQWEGKVWVYHGSPAGLGAAPAWQVESNDNQIFFGTSVSTAGDVNGDGFDDVAIGAYFYSDDLFQQGGVFVWHGGVTGLTNPMFPGGADWSDTGDVDDARLGSSVSTAGDVDGDGYSDLIVGGGWLEFTGEARVYLGGILGLSVAPERIFGGGTKHSLPLATSMAMATRMC